MTKPSFYLSCRFARRVWKDEEFGGKQMFKCVRQNNADCDEKICMRLGAKVTEKHSEKPGIVEAGIDLPKDSPAESSSNSSEGEG